MSDLHRSRNAQVLLPGSGWREACPLPFYGIRRVCRCGRKFWREESYEQHWKIENSRMIYAESDGSERVGPLPWLSRAACGLADDAEDPEVPA